MGIRERTQTLNTLFPNKSQMPALLESQEKSGKKG